MNRTLLSPAARRLLTPVPDPLLRHLMYRWRSGRWGRFTQPERFTEHLNHRMLHDRSPHLALTCDKLRMKAYAAARTTKVHIPETLWEGRDLSWLNLRELPEHWVIKPNHASGAVAFGDCQTTLEQLRAMTAGGLRLFDRAAVGEWAYTQAERTLLIEPRLGGGVPLNDYKLYVFHGEVKLLHVDTGRFSGTFGEQFYLPDFTPVGIVNNAPPPQQPLHAPESLATMVAAAAEIAADFDFMRVDFYEVDGRPWFGELTPYPSGGMDPFEPEWVDHMMGAWWSRRPFNRTPLEQVQLI